MVSSRASIAVDDRCMKLLFGFCCLVLSVLSTACASEDASKYRRALDADYAEYKFADVTDDSLRQRRQSPDSFDNDVLVGDFNFDSLSDFAVVISRKATEKDFKHIRAEQIETETRVFLAVVCNGLSEGEAHNNYRCMPLSDNVVGGFGSELDLLDLSKWGDLSEIHEAYGQAQCPNEMRSLSSKKLLSLREPFGRCTTFYYPDENGTYGQCTYCAD